MDALENNIFEEITPDEPEKVPLTFTFCFVASDIEADPEE